MKINNEVRSYWEKEPCGSSEDIVGTIQKQTPEWFQRIEDYRYQVEPFIHSEAQFTCHKGKKILEIGVGAGTDHLQWARAGADCHGVDLTQAAIDTTTARLKLHGLTSNLQRHDAETLPFPDESFDIVYSWGVIHHSEDPTKIIKEIHRVLKPGGQFIGMLYERYSVAVFKMWIKYALLKGKPWKSFSRIIWDHVESFATKAYTTSELKEMFGQFKTFKSKHYTTESDFGWLPYFFRYLIPAYLGWFIAIRCEK